MSNIETLVHYLKEHHLLLATAESCTAGGIIALLASYPGSGQYLDAGYVVYSPEAKKRLLQVQQATIDQFGLTSEEVTLEMANGALRDSPANVVLATTGVAGPDEIDGIPPGTVCFAWVFTGANGVRRFSSTEFFHGERMAVIKAASVFALKRIPALHKCYMSGD
ncbi:CinA family protein [Azomonas macrocytogenes]|uniref:PncC family amidohydrolase n=1 Tax=Azomonas macrocytogenes TaxID=69962 RepID=A0A839T1V0_AZOMA|nr:CinA family protein [Azomonas macrocytogenes]MBB3101723.1 PncC family amidohydrolase [Azomonas macrocytogenes]